MFTTLKKIFSVQSALSILILFFFLAPLISYSLDYVPLAEIPGTVSNATGGTTLSTYLTGIFRAGIVMAGVLAFLMIVIGGFQYLSTDAMTGKEEGKVRIERAVGGLLLALASYIILYTINPDLVSLNLTLSGTRPASDVGRPPDLISAESAALDRAASEINKNRQATRDEATKLDEAVGVYRAQREAILKEIAAGDNSHIAQFNELQQKIVINQTDAQAIRDYGSAKNGILLKTTSAISEGAQAQNSVGGIYARWIGGAAPAELEDHLDAIDLSVNTATAKLNREIETARTINNPELAAKYTAWLDEIKAYAATSKTQITSAYNPPRP
ncbi:MAG: hypothetical protein V4467_02975 [Patescibacteria group bacterium]